MNLDIIQLIEENPGINLESLKSYLLGTYWKELETKDLRQDCLATLWKQGLIANDKDSYTIGSRWQPIKPYAELLETARKDQRTLEELSSVENWIQRQTLLLR